MPWFNLPLYNTSGPKVNPGVGLKVTDPNSPNFGRSLTGNPTFPLVMSLEKGTFGGATQRQYDAAKDDLSYKSNKTWLILLGVSAILFYLLKRK